MLLHNMMKTKGFTGNPAYSIPADSGPVSLASAIERAPTSNHSRLSGREQDVTVTEPHGILGGLSARRSIVIVASVTTEAE